MFHISPQLYLFNVELSIYFYGTKYSFVSNIGGIYFFWHLSLFAPCSSQNNFIFITKHKLG